MIKEIKVDYDSTLELKKLITTLQKRRKKLLEMSGCKQLSFAASNYNAEHVIPYLHIMYDMPPNYLNLPSTNNKNYVYVHCDPRKPLDIKSNLKHLFLASKFTLTHEPFYVGKGSGNRAYDLNRNDSHRKIRSIIRKANKEVIVSIIDENLFENEALHKESALMDILGLKSILNSGFLVNLDEGLSQDRYRSYAILEEWKDIQKILQINKINFKPAERNETEEKEIIKDKTDINQMESNLDKLKDRYSKFPTASLDFILKKTNTQHTEKD